MVDYTEFIQESNAIEDVYEESAIETSLEAWEYLTGQTQLTHEVLQEAHGNLLGERQPDIAGTYRTKHVCVGNRQPPTPEVVYYEMDALLQRDAPTDGVEAIRWHVDFERIHPFADGNGRFGRLIYLWHCERLSIEPIVWSPVDILLRLKAEESRPQLGY